MPVVGSLAEMVLPESTALVVIDVQHDFCHPQGYFGRSGADLSGFPAVAERISRLMANARTAGASIVFARAVNGPHYVSGPQCLHRRLIGRQTWACPEGSWGAELMPPAEPEPGDLVFEKHRYSIFSNSAVEPALRAAGIRSLLFTGVATNVCVESSLREAFMRDFYVGLVDDCAMAFSQQEHEATVAAVRKYFGPVVQSEEIISIWQGR